MKRIFRHISEFLVLWVIVFSILSYFFPYYFVVFKNFLEYFFSLTMLCVGMLLNPEHVKLLRKKPQRVLAGSLLQYSLMPLFAFITSQFFSNTHIKTGIILVGSVPGAMASNLMSALANADVALSVSITTLSTLLSPLITPFLLKILAGNFVKVHFLKMFFKLLWMVVLPVVAGYFIRLKYSDWASKNRDYFAGTAAIAIIIIVAMVVAENSSNLSVKEIAVVFALLITNLSGYAGGYTVPLVLNWDIPQRKTIAIEVGMQNAGLGTVLALGTFGKTSAIPPAIYTVLCLITSSILVNLWEFMEGRKK